MLNTDRISGSVLAVLVGAIFFGMAGEALAQDTLSKEADAIGKSLEDTAKRTGTYLKSDSFHQTVGRVVDGAGKAFRNGEKWIGQKFDGMSRPDPKKP